MAHDVRRNLYVMPPEQAFMNNSSWICHDSSASDALSRQAETWRTLMIKTLAAIGFGSALMLAPALALADDAAPAAAAPAAAAPAAPVMHHHHHHHHHHVVVHHHHHVKKMEKKMDKPADAPKS
jgi:hypothetical protein